MNYIFSSTWVLLLLISHLASGQVSNDSHKDDSYEAKHKSKFWYQNLKEGSNYFAVKDSFDFYFGKYAWEYSKPRSLGANWLKEKIFYLDKNGFVQPSPIFHSAQSTQQANAANSTSVSGSWTILGPVNSSHTGMSSKGNHGGYVSLVRMDPTNPDKLFVSFLTGGLWTSSDKGVNWTLSDVGFPDDSYRDIDVCLADSQVVYALGENYLIKSTNGGLTWTATTMNSTNYTGESYDIAVSPTNPNVVIARWGNNVYRTTDGGTTWSTIVSGLPTYNVWDCSNTSEMLDWSSNDSSTVYFLSTSNNNQMDLYISRDKGASFSNIKTMTINTSTMSGTFIGWGKLLLPTNTDSFIYVAFGTGTSAYNHRAVQLQKLHWSNGSTQWTKDNMIDGTNDELHHGDIVMDRNDDTKMLYGTYGEQDVHLSTNTGTSFVTSSEQMHYDIRSMDMIDGVAIIGNDGEAVYSLNAGDTNYTITNSIGNHELWGFGSAFKNNLVAAGTNHGPVMIKEAYNGFDWYNGPGADQGNTDVNPLDDRYIYSQGYSNYRFFRTGVHALENQSNYLDLGGIYAYFNSIEFHPNHYYTMITHHAGQYPNGNPNLATWKNSLIKTNDNGNSISIVKTFTDQVFREKISMKNPGHMYVVVGLTNNELWHSADSGVTWTDVTPNSTVTSGYTNISDIAVGDENPNEIWVTYSGVQSTCKVLKSSDYGSTWTNLTQSILTSSPITKIIFQRGSDGGVYVGNRSGIYYRNDTMSSWALLGTGLPQSDIRFMFINYNENKLKIGTSRGAFSHDLYEVSPVNALISASDVVINCKAVNDVQFKDYSVVRNATASWQWTFQGGTPATSTDENPLVSYANASDGFYDVTLIVTDATGSDTQTLVDFIEVADQCGSLGPDSIAGNSAKFASGTYVEVPEVEAKRDAFTLSCWIKPNGIQDDWSGIFMTQSGGAFGLNFRDGDNTLGFHPTWFWSSGLVAEADEWSHVAMVSNGTDVKIYLNGEFATRAGAMSTDSIGSLYLGKYGNGYGANRSTDMEMEELTIWNRALTTDEIRKWRHLIKSDTSDPIFNDMVIYHQFNENIGTLALNKVANKNHGTYSSATDARTISNAPIFKGESEKISITTGGDKNFTNTGLSINFNSSGTKPNGDVWVSRGNVAPDSIPIDGADFGSYTIINNYGTNQTFSSLNTMTFGDNPLFSAYSSTPSDFILYKRESNDFGANWGPAIDTADAISGSGASMAVEFSTGLNISSFSQFYLSQTTTPVPVTLLNFTADRIDADVKLNWTTASELNSYYFDIERSDDGKKWTKIGQHKAEGNSNSVKDYEYFDFNAPQRVLYYRLKQIDIDGSFTFSETRKIGLEETQELKIYPNYVSSGESFKILLPPTWENATMLLYDIQGKVVVKSHLDKPINDLRVFCVPGVYQVVLLNDNKKITGKLSIY